MSQIKVKGNASGTGVFTIESPATNTDRTLTLPDAAGTIALQGGTGVGKVLQVVSASSSTVVTTTGTYVSLLSPSITPTSANSKILVLASGSALISQNTNGYMASAIYRGTTSGTQLQVVYSGLVATGLSSPYGQINHSYLDSPATTSAQTYTLAFNRGSGGTTSVTTENVYSMVLMEIAA